MKHLISLCMLGGLCLIGCEAMPQDPTPGPAPTASASSAAALPLEVASVPQPSPSIDRIDLYALPTGVNVDGRPGADALQARLLLFRVEEPLAVTLQAGRIELMMYDGRISADKVAGAVALRTWSLDAAQLGGHAVKTAVGTGHAMLLRWGDAVPKQDLVTLTARLLRPGQPSLWAAPLYLTTGTR